MATTSSYDFDDITEEVARGEKGSKLELVKSKRVTSHPKLKEVDRLETGGVKRGISLGTDSTSASPLHARLYEFDSNPHFSRTRAILDDIASRSKLAIEALREGNTIGADDHLNRIQLALPELFIASKVCGGGARKAVVSLFAALFNRRCEMLNLEQARTVGALIHAMNSNPLIGVGAVLDHLESMLEVGLDITPPVVSRLTDALDDL